jgi:hypothetical protein
MRNKIVLVLVVVCAVIMTAGSVWALAAIPSHNGSADPTTEGFTASGDTSMGSAGADNWFIHDQSPSNHLYYYNNFSSAALPANWRMTANVKVSNCGSTLTEWATFGLSDASRSWFFTVAVWPQFGIYGLYYRTPTSFSQGFAFTNPDQFHTFTIDRNSAASSIDVYLDGVKKGTLSDSEFPTSQDRVFEFGSLNDNGTYQCTADSRWGEVKIGVVPEPGSLMALGAGLMSLGAMLRRKRA